METFLSFFVAAIVTLFFVRGYLKPISTLRRPLESVDFDTREPVKAAYERSDVCVVPAAGVAAEAMVALTLARFEVVFLGSSVPPPEIARAVREHSAMAVVLTVSGYAERKAVNARLRELRDALGPGVLVAAAGRGGSRQPPVGLW